MILVSFDLTFADVTFRLSFEACVYCYDAASLLERSKVGSQGDIWIINDALGGGAYAQANFKDYKKALPKVVIGHWTGLGPIDSNDELDDRGGAKCKFRSAHLKNVGRTDIANVE